MKSMLTSLTAALFLMVTTPSFAQDTIAGLTKSEKKEWKKKANYYKRNPHQLKALQEKHISYKEQLAQKNHEIGMAEIETNDLRKQLALAKTTIWEMTEKMNIDSLSPNNVGVVFKLQVGAFAETKLPTDLEEAKKVDVEDIGGLQKIVIGSFRDYEKAERLGVYLKQMGIHDAWIVAYEDGERVPIEEIGKKVIKP